MSLKAPWLSSYRNVPETLEYPDCSMVEMIFRSAEKYPDYDAYLFSGCSNTFREFTDEIRLCGRGLLACGIKKGNRVTICMPNTPQALTMFYAVNLVGAVANMVHPLSAEMELVDFINKSHSVAAFTLDQFSEKLLKILPKTKAKTLILASVADGLSGITKPLYNLTKGRKIVRQKTGGTILRYTDLLQRGSAYQGEYDAKMHGDDVAAILYSGGTSGDTKGILLTNRNFNALGLQTIAASDCVKPGSRMMAIMPVFHGFGLGVCVHAMLIHGAMPILVPQFSIATYAKLLAKTKPNLIAGVPTLYEGMLKMKGTDGLDLSFLHGIFSGGDTLSIELKRKVDAFLKEHGSTEQIREGFGLTETVTANCLTPRTFHKEGSIGIPYPDMFYKIVKPGTQEELAYGEDGEICVTGPTMMKGYDNNPEETAKTLQTHSDGHTWVHTGDMGSMDEEGFIYFRQRIKRMIKSSGYNIYPTQLENAIEAHEAVLISCVIGLPDEYKGQRVKAFIVLRDGVVATDEIKSSILEHCKKHIAKYALPGEIEYRDDLPRTIVGKVAFIELEREELEKMDA